MATWTDERKQQVFDAYKAGNPTPANSTELVRAIAEEMDESVNGVRMILSKENLYIKKDATADKGKVTGKEAATKAPRVSKDDQIAELRTAIEEKGVEVDDEILTKLTGKAAAYFTKVLSA